MHCWHWSRPNSNLLVYDYHQWPKERLHYSFWLCSDHRRSSKNGWCRFGGTLASQLDPTRIVNLEEPHIRFPSSFLRDGQQARLLDPSRKQHSKSWNTVSSFPFTPEQHLEVLRRCLTSSRRSNTQSPSRRTKMQPEASPPSKTKQRPWLFKVNRSSRCKQRDPSTPWQVARFTQRF